MLLYGTSPDFIYSAMNGYGHYLARERWFELYWGGAALMLMVLSVVFWPRGYNAEAGSRLQLARRHLTTPVLASFGAGLLLFVGTGALLYYNLHVANHFQTGLAARMKCGPNTSAATNRLPPCPSPASPTSTCRWTWRRKRAACACAAPISWKTAAGGPLPTSSSTSSATAAPASNCRVRRGWWWPTANGACMPGA